MDETVYSFERIEAPNQDNTWKKYEHMFAEESRIPAKKFVRNHANDPTAVPRSNRNVAKFKLRDGSGATRYEFKFVTSFSATPFVTDEDAPRGVPYALIKAYNVDVSTNVPSMMYKEYVTAEAV